METAVHNDSFKGDSRSFTDFNITAVRNYSYAGADKYILPKRDLA